MLYVILRPAPSAGTQCAHIAVLIKETLAGSDRSFHLPSVFNSFCCTFADLLVC